MTLSTAQYQTIAEYLLLAASECELLAKGSVAKAHRASLLAYAKQAIALATEITRQLDSEACA